MLVELVHGDIVKSTDDAVIITVDGAAKGLEGNISRQFKQVYGEDWEIVEESFAFPISLGCSAYVETDPPIPNKIVFAASILDHRNVVNRHQMPGVVRSALSEIFETAVGLRLESISCPLLKGGWRMDAITALKVMVAVSDDFLTYHGILRIYILERTEYEQAVGYGQSFGLLS